AATLVPRVGARTIWMLSSTEVGGGVAEMMPRVVALLRELGVRTEWLVMRPADPAFFALTKRLHNLVHGSAAGELGGDDRALYESVSQQCAEDLAAHVSPGDLVVAHDPQPVGAAAFAHRALGLPFVWRCHIGSDEENAATRAAWTFLQPYVDTCAHAIFSAPEYIRDFLAGRASIMHPTIDPLSHKNRELAPTKLVGILCNAGLLNPTQPVLTPPFEAPALRLRADGTFTPAALDGDLGLLFRPIVTQISRWDRLKGFAPLLDAFCALKQRPRHDQPPRQQRRLEIVRLVLAGPDPRGVQDDPEAIEVLDELSARYRRLPPALQADIALLTLPTVSRKHNALMVNSLQRCSSVVVQNSLREGFGLTATEAMWKGVPVLASSACGLRQQVRDGLDGRLVGDATRPDEIAGVLVEVLGDAKQRQAWGRSGQRRVLDEFLVFAQLRGWLRVFSALQGAP
ncbi:MAG: glycosyltransferase, partial [Polyangia bacterium]